MRTIRVGDIFCTKAITHRIPVEIIENAGGKQRVRANSFGYRFQVKDNPHSTVGVFVFLGTHHEQMDGAAVQEFAENQLRRLGWRVEEPASAGAVDPSATDPGTPPTRETA